MGRCEKHRIAKGILPLTLLCTFIACTYQQPILQPAPEETPPPVEIPLPPTSEPRIYLHKVRWPGETLSHIAKWYTGAINNWEAIAKVNPELDPKKINVGDTISIPEDLLTAREPMPRSFLPGPVQKKRVPVSTSKKTPVPLESPKLFEPIESEPSTIETDSAKLFGPEETEPPPIEPDTEKLFGPVE